MNTKTKIYCFHHSDLDGMGVKILSIMYANELNSDIETFKCNYNDINSTVLDTLRAVNSTQIREVIIGDISVNEEVAEYLDWLVSVGVPVRLRDHHDTAVWLNKYDWAMVAEKEHNGTPRCGTYWLSKSDGFEEIADKMSTFIQETNSWDTWLWKSLNDTYAKDLNALFQILGETEFTDYILKASDTYVQTTMPEALFNDYAKHMIEAHTRQVKKTANSCEKAMWETNLILKNEEAFKTGIVFCNQDLSDVGDIILSNRPDLDILMLVGFPRNISLRTQKNLSVPLGEIASMLTGSGGGHPQAAGCVISQSQFESIFKNFMISCGNSVTYDELKLSKKEDTRR